MPHRAAQNSGRASRPLHTSHRVPTRRSPADRHPAHPRRGKTRTGPNRNAHRNTYSHTRSGADAHAAPAPPDPHTAAYPGANSHTL